MTHSSLHCLKTTMHILQLILQTGTYLDPTKMFPSSFELLMDMSAMIIRHYFPLLSLQLLFYYFRGVTSRNCLLLGVRSINQHSATPSKPWSLGVTVSQQSITTTLVITIHIFVTCDASDWRMGAVLSYGLCMPSGLRLNGTQRCATQLSST